MKIKFQGHSPTATDFEGYIMERFGYLNYGDASATELMR